VTQRTRTAGSALSGGTEKVEFENEHVRVVRAANGPRGRTALRSRRDRVLVFLTDSHECARTAQAKRKKYATKLETCCGGRRQTIN
jgi:hypothetical protein